MLGMSCKKKEIGNFTDVYFQMTCEAMHLQMLQDNHPENERACLDPDHWYEINLTNASLFSNLYLEDVPGLEQLVPGRLFTTRMPRKIEEDLNERAEFINKCQKNDLQVVLVLTEAFEFQKYCCTFRHFEYYNFSQGD